MKNIITVVDYIKHNQTQSRRCNCCGRIVLKEPTKEIYPYYCPKCNKYLLEIDTIESYMPITNEEIYELIKNYFISTNKKEN